MAVEITQQHEHLIPIERAWEELFGSGYIVVSLYSRKTGAHKTFEIERWPGAEGKERPLCWWIRQLTGPDNNQSFHYLMMAEGKDDGYISLKLTRKSPKAGWDHEAIKVFLWLFKAADGQDPQVSQAAGVEVWEACACGRCAQRLTNPKSIKRGYGPTCWELRNG